MTALPYLTYPALRRHIARPGMERHLVRAVRLSIAQWHFLAAAATANESTEAEMLQACVEDSMNDVSLDGWAVLVPGREA